MQILIKPLKEIGRGGFAAVYFGKLDGEEYAMKKFYSEKSKNAEEEKKFVYLANPHIVTVVGCSTKGSRECFLLFPFSENGPLRTCEFASNYIKFVVLPRRLTYWRVKNQHFGAKVACWLNIETFYINIAVLKAYKPTNTYNLI